MLRLIIVCWLYAYLTNYLFINKPLNNKYKASYKRRYYNKSFLNGIIILYYKKRNINNLKDFY
jgi:hypothetical protein